MFTGSQSHAPDILWSQVCKEEGADAIATDVPPTTDNSTTVEPPTTMQGTELKIRKFIKIKKKYQFKNKIINTKFELKS